MGKTKWISLELVYHQNIKMVLDEMIYELSLKIEKFILCDRFYNEFT